MLIFLGIVPDFSILQEYLVALSCIYIYFLCCR